MIEKSWFVGLLIFVILCSLFVGHTAPMRYDIHPLAWLAGCYGLAVLWVLGMVLVFERESRGLKGDLIDGAVTAVLLTPDTMLLGAGPFYALTGSWLAFAVMLGIGAVLSYLFGMGSLRFTPAKR